MLLLLLSVWASLGSTWSFWGRPLSRKPKRGGLHIRSSYGQIPISLGLHAVGVLTRFPKLVRRVLGVLPYFRCKLRCRPGIPQRNDLGIPSIFDSSSSGTQTGRYIVKMALLAIHIVRIGCRMRCLHIVRFNSHLPSSTLEVDFREYVGFSHSVEGFVDVWEWVTMSDSNLV